MMSAHVLSALARDVGRAEVQEGSSGESGPLPSPSPASPLPVRCPPLAVLVDFQQELRGVDGRGGTGIQQELLMLGQVLGGGLLGQARTVQELPLQQGQVCLHGGTGGCGHCRQGPSVL